MVHASGSLPARPVPPRGLLIGGGSIEQSPKTRQRVDRKEDDPPVQHGTRPNKIQRHWPIRHRRRRRVAPVRARPTTSGKNRPSAEKKNAKNGNGQIKTNNNIIMQARSDTRRSGPVTLSIIWRTRETTSPIRRELRHSHVRLRISGARSFRHPPPPRARWSIASSLVRVS